MTKKEEYIDKLTTQLKEWNATIDHLASKVELQAMEHKIKLLRELDELRTRRLDAHARLRQLRGTTGDAWETLAAGMDKAWDDLKEAVHQTAEKFKQPR